MLENERELWGTFEHYVPLALARSVLLDVSRVQYRHVDEGMPPARLRELASQALAFGPDPFARVLPTFHRMVFLHALYDIALSFEHSPLIGCTVLALGPQATANGHPLVARAFDFEAGEVFDRDKAVFFVKEKGKIPFASVAWPGLVGVVTGMNGAGLYVSVNGARAGVPRTTGIPVVFSLREILSEASTTEEAIALLSRQTVMVSHLVFVADARGHFAVVERAPLAPAFVRASPEWPDPDRVVLTNHYEGPLRDDEKDHAVREHTSTMARRARGDELVASVPPHGGDVPRMVAMLRDHLCASGQACALGDRRTVDALIATHGVVADTEDRVLWVSSYPHLSGKFVKFDLKSVFTEGHDPQADGPQETLPEDPILQDGRYEAARAAPEHRQGEQGEQTQP